MNEEKVIKLCLEELNQAYRLCRIEAEKVNSPEYILIMGRDPLAMNNMNAMTGSELDIFLKLRFEFDYNLGRKGSWYCVSDVDVIDLED